MIDQVSFVIIILMSIIGYKRSAVGMLLYFVYAVLWTFGYSIVMNMLPVVFTQGIINMIYNVLAFIIWVFITSMLDPLIIFFTKKIPLNKFFGMVLGFMLGIIMASINYEAHVIYYQYDSTHNWQHIIKPSESSLEEIQNTYTHKAFYNINRLGVDKAVDFIYENIAL